jgi:hypothetical protein
MRLLVDRQVRAGHVSATRVADVQAMDPFARTGFVDS